MRFRAGAGLRVGLWIAILGVFSALCAPAFAQAEQDRAGTLVLVVGLRPQDGDDELANAFSAVLRRAAEQVPGWTVQLGENTLDQLVIAHDCMEANDDCLARIARTFNARVVIYGTFVRSPPRGYEVIVHGYDAYRNTVTQVATERISRRRTDIDDLREPAQRIIRVISGSVQPIPAASTAAPTTISPERTAHDWNRDDAPPPRPTEPNPETRTDPRVIERWTGLGSVIIGAGFFTGAIYGWVRMSQIKDDPDLSNYRARFPSSVSNVCNEAADGNPGSGGGDGVALASRVDSLCRESKMWNVLQYVFVGLGVVGVGAGTYLLIRSTRELEEPAFSLVPSVGPTGGSLTAAWRF